MIISYSSYFTSSTALALMLLDEYGSVQQHLQPRHIQEMLIPVPDDWSLAQDMIDAGNMFIKAIYINAIVKVRKRSRIAGCFIDLIINAVLDIGKQHRQKNRGVIIDCSTNTV